MLIQVVLTYLSLASTIYGAAINSNPSTSESSKRPKIHHVKSQNLPESVKLFEDTSNIIKVTKNKGEEKTFIYNYDEKAWYSYELLDEIETILLPYQIPVSSCYDNIYGPDGSSLELDYEIDLSLKYAVAPSTKLKISDFGFTALIGLEFGPSFSYVGTYTCNVDEGQVAQLFMQPFYVVTPEIARRKVNIKKNEIVEEESDIDSVANDFIPPMKLLTKKVLPNHICTVVTSLDDERLSCEEGSQIEINPDDL